MVWQSAENDQWYANIGGVNFPFDTEQEAHIFMANQALAKEVVRNMQGLGKVFEETPELIVEWYLNPPTEGDCEALGLTLASMGACITALEQFGKWMDGATGEGVVAAQYKANYYTVKRVSA